MENELTTHRDIKSSGKKIASIYLDSDLTLQLDAFAKRLGVSRSWLVGRVLEGWLFENKDNEIAEFSMGRPIQPREDRLRAHDGSWDGSE
ncbi:MAG: ribbon-helix-helix domain-containing protein [Methylocella sp.]